MQKQDAIATDNMLSTSGKEIRDNVFLFILHK